MKKKTFEQERLMTPEFLILHSELMSAATEAFNKTKLDNPEIADVMTSDGRYGQLIMRNNQWHTFANLWLKDSDNIGYSLYLETDLSGSLDLRGWARLPQLMWWEDLENGWGDAVVVNSSRGTGFASLLPVTDFTEYIAPDVLKDFPDLQPLNPRMQKLGQSLVGLV